MIGIAVLTICVAVQAVIGIYALVKWRKDYIHSAKWISFLQKDIKNMTQLLWDRNDIIKDLQAKIVPTCKVCGRFIGKGKVCTHGQTKKYPLKKKSKQVLIREKEEIRLALWIASGKKFSERNANYTKLLEEGKKIFKKTYPAWSDKLKGGSRNDNQ